MTDIRIASERVPWWYELEWRPGPGNPGLLIHIRTEIIQEYLTEAAIARYLFPPGNGFGEFAATEESFGYGSCFSWQPRDKESRSLVLPIPVIEKENKEPCHLCNGTGKSFYDDETICFACNGRKKERRLDWDTAYQISATLTVLFRRINYLTEIAESSKSQLLMLETVTARELHGGSLSGTYNQTLIRWLMRLHPGTPLTCMTEAMRLCHSTQFSENFESREFKASINDKHGSLNIGCAGDACGLHPTLNYRAPSEGYSWSSHNVDSPMQQLTLIAGLAALSTKVRAAGVL